MIYQNSRSVAHGPGAWLPAAFAALAVVAFGSCGSPVNAQQAQAAPVKSPAGAAQETKQSSWVKLCDTPQNFEKKVCLTRHDRLDGNTGSLLVSAAIQKIEGMDKERFLVMVPLGIAIQPGVRIAIDDQKPIPLKYSTCHAGGCTAEVMATSDLVSQLKKGSKMVVAALSIAGETIGFRVPLNGFTKAYQGPPVDNKQYHEARRKVLSEIRKHQEELRKQAQAAQKTSPGGQPTTKTR